MTDKESNAHTDAYFYTSTILKQLIEGNNDYAEKNHVTFENLKQKQTPKVTLVTCCDSRVPTDLFNTESLNHIFTVRNIGNQFSNSEGSIKYPILHLKTPLLIILGHTGCGALKASLSDYRIEDEAMQREVIGLVNAINLANETTSVKHIEDENHRLAVYAQINVDYQISRLMADCKIRSKVLSKQLCIVGMVFDIHGMFGNQEARVYITNIDGVTDLTELRRHEIAFGIGGVRDDLFKRI
jgi:carbonic anhydrase